MAQKEEEKKLNASNKRKKEHNAFWVNQIMLNHETCITKNCYFILVNMYILLGPNIIILPQKNHSRQQQKMKK